MGIEPPPLITGAFADALKAGRESFNARFAAARRQHPTLRQAQREALDGAAFLDLLRTAVAPIVEAVHRARPEVAGGAASELYDLALDLFAHDLLGPNGRYPLLAAGWRELLPALGSHLATAPRRVAGAVSNALYNLSQMPGARPAEWIKTMRVLAPLCADAPTLLTAGQVAAWCAGMAHFREGALDLCAQLPPAVVQAALDASETARQLPPAELVGRLRADPWLKASQISAQTAPRQLKIVARAGTFRGFGGLFLAPPTVGMAGEQLIVRDGAGGAWQLTADAYGATFHPAEDVRAAQGSGAFQVTRGGKVTLDKLSADFPELADFTSVAGNNHTLAVTTALSHAVWLIAAV